MRAVLFLSLLGACGRVGFDDRALPDAGDPDAAPPAYTAVVLADNPRFFYRLEEGNGPVARDATGQYDAGYELFGGSIMFGQAGALQREASSAVLFMGDGNSGPNIGASVERAPIEVFQGDFTVELFFKPTGLTPAGFNSSLFICEDYLDSGFRFGIHPDSNVELWTDEAGATSRIRGVTPLAIGSWSYLVAVKRGSNAEIWIDGRLEVASPIDMTPPSLTSGMTECGFAAFHGLPAYGVFDEVAAYDRALSPAQIAQHFAAR